MAKYLAGIDIGTTGAKSAIFDLEGNILGSSYCEYTCTYPKPNWVEQDIEYVIEETMRCCKKAIASSKVDPKDIAGVSISAQRCTSIFLDKNGKPLKIISWQDNRTGLEVEQIKEKISPSEYYKITGLPLNTTWILSKLLWLQNNEPSTFEKVDKIVQVQDYALKALGVEDYYVDIPDAGFYGVWDTDNFKWSEKLLSLFNIDQNMFSKPMPSGTMVGKVCSEASSISGLAVGTPLCVGVGDQNSATVGAGIVESGNASVSIGTGGMATAYLDKPYRDSSEQSMVTNHAIYGKWQLEGYQAGAAGVFRWFRDEIATLENAYASNCNKDTFELLNDIIKDTPVGSKGLIVLPYFASSTAPRWNSNARGTVLGLTIAHDRGCLARAFMEGITMEQKDIIHAMLNTGITIKDIHIIGGSTKSEIWNQMQADMYNKTVKTLKVTDAAVLGAAIIAGVGVGIFSSIEEGARKMVVTDKVYEPIKENVEIYNELYEVYCKAYEGLSEHEVFDKIASIQGKI